ncbi:hypothetical protein LNV09_24285, partial [Paucibacter sp. B2R-40]|uniref:beta strand repeat-containing protein n=1 Tax=Paucibacter sp. B2R-40 TaxID=2893554 RepID=UPI0021E4659D
GTSTITATGSNVTLTDSANNFGGAATITGAAISLRDIGALSAALTATGNSTLQAAGNLVVSGSSVDLTTSAASGTTSFGATTVSGNLNVTSVGAVTQAAATALTVSGSSSITASGVDVTLAESGNNFGGVATVTAKDISLRDGGALSAALISSGNSTLQAAGTLLVSGTGATLTTSTTGAGATTFGTTTLSGNLSVTSAGAVAQVASTALTVAGSSSINAGINAIALTQASNDFQGEVSLIGSTTQLTDANALTLGSLNTGALSANATGVLNLGSGTVSSLTALSNGGAITQTGGLNVSGVSNFNAGAGTVTLVQTSNDFQGAVSLTGSTAQIRDTNALILGNLSTGALTAVSTGDLNLGSGTVSSLTALSNGGAISQSGGLTVSGSSSVNAGARSITLTQANNDFQGLVTLEGGLVQITDANALTVVLNSSGSSTATSGGELQVSGTAAGFSGATTAGAIRFGATTVIGDLNLHSAAAVSQVSGTALRVSGSGVITAGANDVTLVEANNDFGGLLTVSGANIGLRDSNALNVRISATGTGTVTAGSGDLMLAGSTTGNLSTSSAKGISFGATTVGAGLTAAAGADLTQSAALSVHGVSVLSSAEGSITLDKTGNDFQSAVTATADAAGKTVALVSANALDLSLSAGGSAVATAVAGPLTVKANTAAGLQLNSGAAISIGDTTVGRGLTATAQGSITQTANITTGAASELVSKSGSITLTQSGNDFVGILSATAAQDVSLLDANSLTLALSTGRAGNATSSAGDLSISGSTGAGLTTQSGGSSQFGPMTVGAALSSQAGGNVTQSGPLVVATSANMASSSGSVILPNATNDFVGVLAITAAHDVAVRDVNSLRLNLTAGGAGTARAGSDLTISGTAGTSLNTQSGAGTSFGATQVGGYLSSNSNGAVTQSAAIAAAGLELQGPGSVTLENIGNQLPKIAATSASPTDGAISLLTVGDLTVDGVATSVGIVRTGRVSLNALSGDILLKENVNVSDSNLSLRSSGLVSQAAGKSIQASGLELLGAAAFVLQEPTNHVEKIALGGGFAGPSSGPGASAYSKLDAGTGIDGVVTFVNATALQVDKVNASVGIARSGNVDLSNLSGALSLNEAINTGAANLTLQSNGAVTQAAGKPITAAGLELKGSGSFILTEVSNNVAKLAMASGGAGDGAVQYLDADALAVDTVNSVGVSRSGDVSLRNLSGDLTLAQLLNLPGKTLRLDSAAGAVTQSAGKISVTDLGLRAASNIALNQSNSVSGNVAARAENGDVLLQNANGYVIGNVSSDGSMFAGVSGLAAPGAGKNITLLTAAGTVTQAAGSNLTASGLELQGAAAYTLTNPGNNIAKFAATQGAASDGAVNYVDADGFELSSVAAVGVTRSGTVDLSNEAGRLSLAPLAASIVSVSGGSIAIASPQAVDGKISLPVFTLSGNIALSKGALSLKAMKASKADDDMFAKYRSDIGIAKEIILVDAVGRPIKILADVIVQSGGSIKVASEGRMNLLADQGGSASLLEAGNDFAGGLSANLTGAKAGSSGTAEESLPRSLLRLRGGTVNISGEGINADAAFIAADRLATLDAAVITARMSYSNTLGTRTQMPALLFDMGPNAFDGTQSSPFGAHPGADIQIKVGTEVIQGQGQSQAGFASVRPSATLDATRTQNLLGKRAAIFLAGPETGVAGYLFFYDGAGSQLEIPIYYNGYAPSSPQVEGALSSIASVSEAARRDRFEEAVRTENVAARLRGGVISEVGPGSPATAGSTGAAEPKSCAMAGSEGAESKLKCKI